MEFGSAHPLGVAAVCHERREKGEGVKNTTPVSVEASSVQVYGREALGWAQQEHSGPAVLVQMSKGSEVKMG